MEWIVGIAIVICGIVGVLALIFLVVLGKGMSR